MAMPIAKRCKIEEVYIDMSLDSLISSLQEDRARLTAAGWTDIVVELENDEVFSASLWGTRMETEQEAEDRESRDTHYAQFTARRAELATLAKNALNSNEEGN